MKHSFRCVDFILLMLVLVINDPGCICASDYVSLKQKINREQVELGEKFQHAETPETENEIRNSARK
ncbi:hypothetical protein K8T06_10540 [bacterium]|nr:hypothetical protein [bacterium]